MFMLLFYQDICAISCFIGNRQGLGVSHRGLIRVHADFVISHLPFVAGFEDSESSIYPSLEYDAARVYLDTIGP